MHAVITGASSGIGAALARELHAGGARVTLVARRENLLAALASELGDRCTYIVRDLTDTSTDWLSEGRRLGPIDVFVNNAGAQVPGPFVSSEEGARERMVALDLMAPIALARAVVPEMVARGAGVIVNVSSLVALAPPAGMASYAGAKAGLAAFSEALGDELASAGVHVLTVYPGPIDNGSPQEAYELYGRRSIAGRLPVGRADALAREIVVAIRRRRRRLIFPRFYAVAWWLGPLVRWLVGRSAPRRLAAPAEGAALVRE
ncbi:MAG: SDR family NAD(P)-dependent oxidoreductase [Polyangiaceae bacterium]